MRFRGALLLVVVGFAGPAMAQPPAYAHKANVDEATMNTEEKACFDDANRAMRDPSLRLPYSYNPVTQSTVGGAVGAGIAQGFMQGRANAKRFNITLYECMTSKGYTMHRATEADWKTVKKLPPAERQAAMFKWRSAAEPLHPAMTRHDFE